MYISRAVQLVISSPAWRSHLPAMLPDCCIYLLYIHYAERNAAGLRVSYFWTAWTAKYSAKPWFSPRKLTYIISGFWFCNCRKIFFPFLRWVRAIYIDWKNLNLFSSHHVVYYYLSVFSSSCFWYILTWLLPVLLALYLILIVMIDLISLGVFLLVSPPSFFHPVFSDSSHFFSIKSCTFISDVILYLCVSILKNKPSGVTHLYEIPFCWSSDTREEYSFLLCFICQGICFKTLIFLYSIINWLSCEALKTLSLIDFFINLTWTSFGS